MYNKVMLNDFETIARITYTIREEMRLPVVHYTTPVGNLVHLQRILKAFHIPGSFHKNRWVYLFSLWALIVLNSKL